VSPNSRLFLSVENVISDGSSQSYAWQIKAIWEPKKTKNNTKTTQLTILNFFILSHPSYSAEQISVTYI